MPATSPNILDTYTRAPWEIDDEELEAYDDPFDDDTPAALSHQQIIEEVEARRDNARHYLTSDPARNHTWLSVTVLPAETVAEMLESGATHDEIVKMDTTCRNQHHAAGIESRRDTRAAIYQRFDGADIMEIADALNTPHHCFDDTAKLLGAGRNWSSETNRKARDIRMNQRGARMAAASFKPAPSSNNYDVAMDEEWKSTAPAAGISPQPITTQNQPPAIVNDEQAAQNREDFARHLAQSLKFAAKGLNYTRAIALVELAKGKVNERTPALWVRNLPPRTLADLNLRLQIASEQATISLTNEREQQAVKHQRLNELTLAMDEKRAELHDIIGTLERVYPNAPKRWQELRGDVDYWYRWEFTNELAKSCLQNADEQAMSFRARVWANVRRHVREVEATR